MYGKDSSPVITRTIIKTDPFLKDYLMRKHSWCYWVKFTLEIIRPAGDSGLRQTQGHPNKLKQHNKFAKLIQSD